MNNDLVNSICLGIFMVVLIVISFWWGWNSNKIWQYEAVKHKAGKFVILNEYSGQTKFYWNDEITSKILEEEE